MDSQQIFLKYDMIRHSVSAVDVGKVLGLDINTKGRCRCPFHNGDDRNMMVYPGGRGFYCFVCHEFGDSIKLAQKLIGNGCTYHDAAVWVDKTFQLNIFENTKPSLRERIRRAELYKRRFGGRVNEIVP